MNTMSLCNEMRMYQPVPFEDYKNITADRVDCEERYQVIKKNYGSFAGKMMYDLCSANCYFGFRFLQDGGNLVMAIEKDESVRKFVNQLAEEKQVSLICCKEPIDGEMIYDIGLYLDSHYHEGTDGYIEHMKKRCKTVFTSPSADNEKYLSKLKTLFQDIEEIYNGYCGRKMYKCW